MILLKIKKTSLKKLPLVFEDFFKLQKQESE